MRVLLSPGAGESEAGRALAAALAASSAGDPAAGPEPGPGPGAPPAEEAAAGAGSVVFLERVGVKNLRRRLSAAEVHALRKALLGLGPGRDLEPRRPEDVVVGYVCTGVPVGAPGPSLVAVEDHANLTWESPLAGPNDDRLGPRFPVVAGLYVPELVPAALSEAAGSGVVGSAEAPGAGGAAGSAEAPVPPWPPVVSGVVAGVWDERRWSPFERSVIERDGFVAVSAELTHVAVTAAHLGFRVAAVVVASPGE